MQLQTVTMQCGKGHSWGDGKAFELTEKCPECGDPVAMLLTRTLMTPEEVKARFGTPLSDAGKV